MSQKTATPHAHAHTRTLTRPQYLQHHTNTLHIHAHTQLQTESLTFANLRQDTSVHPIEQPRHTVCVCVCVCALCMCLRAGSHTQKILSAAATECRLKVQTIPHDKNPH